MISLPSPIALQDLVGPASDRLARDLALLGGPGGQTAVPIVGDGSVAISGLSSSSEAAAGALCFAVRREFLEEARGLGAAAVIVGPALLEEAGPGWAGPALVVFSEPRLLFSVILGLQGEAFSPPWAAAEPFFKDRGSCDIGQGVVFGPFSYVGAGVSVGQGTRVGPRVFLDDGVSLGRDCVIHPGAVLRFGVRVGDRCQIHSNAVVGEDGFGYNQVPCPGQGRLVHYKNPHLGGVRIGDDVEIGALAAIDRGLVADTVIGRGTKIDNLVQIGHNCQVGQDCVVVAQVGAAGHSQVGDRAFLLGQSGLNHGARIGHDAVIAGQSGVLGEIPPGRDVWTGTPARPQREEYTSQILVKNDLPKWRKFLRLFMKGRSLDDIREALAEDREKPSG